MFPKKLHTKLKKRITENSFRTLSLNDDDKIDFYSNDYLGYARDSELYHKAHQWINTLPIKNGATGSRLISGNFKYYEELEIDIANFHKAEASLLYNSGYVANVGFFSSVPQRGDIVFYDELIHASIRDALSVGFAKSVKFKHNDLYHLEKVLTRYKDTLNADLYIVTESVFSMDGDCPDLKKMIKISHQYRANLVVDEAHGFGIFGKKGEGLVQDLGLENEVFARIITYGKSLGGHGAAIVGSQLLKEYLINFSRSFIYTTALSPNSIAHIKLGYSFLEQKKNIIELRNNITYFNKKINQSKSKSCFISSRSAIHSLMISGNEKVKNIANILMNEGYEVKPILSPTVPKEKERLRITLHAYNTKEEINDLFTLLNKIL